MFIIGNLIITMAGILSIILYTLLALIFLRALISWVNADQSNPLVQFLFQTTEPILAPIRKYLPKSLPLDFSPFVAMLLIFAVHSFLIATLRDIGFRLKM